jgi:hypothetical protein
MYKKFMLALSFACAPGVHAALFNDSFDDNSRDRSIWAPPAVYVNPTNTIASADYAEQNQRLEFTVSRLTTNDFESGAWQDSLMMLNAELNWSLTADIHNSADVTANNIVEIGLGLYAHAWGAAYQEIGIWLRSTSDGLKLFETAYSNYESNEALDYPEVLTADGTIRIAYTATNQLIEISYANSPSNQYHLVKSVDTSEWNDIMNTGFILDTWAQSINTEVESGELFLDNISVSDDIVDVAVGHMFLQTTNDEAHLSLQLEMSEDLTTWTNAGNAVNWVIPVETNQQFFRVRSAP